MNLKAIIRISDVLNWITCCECFVITGVFSVIARKSGNLRFILLPEISDELFSAAMGDQAWSSVWSDEPGGSKGQWPGLVCLPVSSDIPVSVSPQLWNVKLLIKLWIMFRITRLTHPWPNSHWTQSTMNSAAIMKRPDYAQPQRGKDTRIQWHHHKHLAPGTGLSSMHNVDWPCFVFRPRRQQGHGDWCCDHRCVPEVQTWGEETRPLAVSPAPSPTG